MSKSAAGVACGLILDSKSGSSDNPRYQLLSDISVDKKFFGTIVEQIDNY